MVAFERTFLKTTSIEIFSIAEKGRTTFAINWYTPCCMFNYKPNIETYKFTYIMYSYVTTNMISTVHNVCTSRLYVDVEGLVST